MTGKVNFNWEQFWAYFASKDTPVELRVAIWKDLRLAQFLERMAASAQIEVLEHAPDRVKHEFKDVLKPEAREKLLPDKPFWEMTRDEIYEKLGYKKR